MPWNLIPNFLESLYTKCISFTTDRQSLPLIFLQEEMSFSMFIIVGWQLSTFFIFLK